MQRFFCFIVLFLLLAFDVYGQEKILPDGTDGLTFTVHKGDSMTGRIKNPDPNEFDGTYSTFKIGLGLIYDFANYAQNDVFRQQMDSAGYSLGPTFKLRDFRILGSGRLKTNRMIGWKFAYMWDGANQQWLIRESGVTVGVPELAGYFFAGRTKEGYSMVKVMNGHSPWTEERQMALDPIPILADGIKYFGYLPSAGVFWNLGAYNDLVSKGQAFSTFKWQYVARIGWMRYLNSEKDELIHLGVNLRYGKPEGDTFIIRSRPESNPTPQIMNTGEFNTDKSSHIGYEAYYSNDRLMLGSEAMVHNFYSSKAENHHFYGGDFVISYFFTDTRRPYLTNGNIFGFVNVKRSLFKGGPGEWEGVVHVSTFNLNDGDIHGGQFWRITPMVNWFVSKVIRMEFVYGYGIFDRYGLKGHVQFFESRIQFTVM